MRIGIDLGGTHIGVGLVDGDNKIISRAEISTVKDDAEKNADNMARLCRLVCERSGIDLSQCKGIGIGSPGNSNSFTGTVIRAYNLGWYNVPICKMLSEKTGIPVFLDNDASCAALGEVAAGAAMGCKDAVMVTLGTGVGGGFIIGGRIYSGYDGAGAEAGHICISFDGEQCSCGRKGCYEAYASVTALIKQTVRAAKENPSSLLNGYEKFDGRTVFIAADNGDEVAKNVISRYLMYVGAGITDLMNLFSPECVIVGGAISREGERILKPIREYVADNCFGGRERKQPRIVAAALGNDAGIIGAATLPLING